MIRRDFKSLENEILIKLSICNGDRKKIVLKNP
jgi:hypothetical protein